jgi:hypothetical protein
MLQSKPFDPVTLVCSHNGIRPGADDLNVRSLQLQVPTLIDSHKPNRLPPPHPPESGIRGVRGVTAACVTGQGASAISALIRTRIGQLIGHSTLVGPKPECRCGSGR